MEKNQSTHSLHLGFIVDGNRRWAKEQGLPTLKGHQTGLKKVEMVITELATNYPEVKFASFFLFSTENWQRSKEEVSYLMNLAKTEIIKLAKKMAKNNVRCLIFGSEQNVEPSLLQKLKEAEDLTKGSTGLTACICFNYGGQQEIAEAAKKMALEIHPTFGMAPTSADLDAFFTPENIAKYLYHPEVPPCDMIIRTSGEQRISGFMLWRSAYSEFLFLDKYFPSIEPEDLTNILQEYKNRHRRFGK